ncbi:MAG: M48 family metallopeptidase [Snodgrassella sp.]|nr:M48 family metallopeptidase [Snodgrassella sp.]
MSLLKYTARNGELIELKFKRSARKKIILRLDRAGNVSINVPSCLTLKKVQHWLCDNEHNLIQFWLQAQQIKQTVKALPKKIWFRGQSYMYEISQTNIILWNQQLGFTLPDLPLEDLRQLIVNWLKAQAQNELITRLGHWAQIMQLWPKAMALSQSKTFWGVCRNQTGIRLNWRLIGAPDYVIDYVCIHELSHLKHPNHSQAFWSLVAQYTSQIAQAKMWLRQYGYDLFKFD